MPEQQTLTTNAKNRFPTFALSLLFALGAVGATHSATHAQSATSPHPSGKSAFVQSKKDTRTTWSFAGGSAGWTTLNLGKGRSDGVGRYYPLTGGVPQLVSLDLDIPLDAYNTIEIKIALSRGVTDPTMRVFFATDSQPKFSNDRGNWLKLKPDGLTRTYRIYFGAHPNWKGQLAKLRLDPAGAGAKGGVRIERISLLYDTPPALGPSFP